MNVGISVEEPWRLMLGFDVLVLFQNPAEILVVTEDALVKLAC